MPLFRPQFDLDENTIIRAIRNLVNVSSSIAVFELIGGEPFLASNLYPVLSFLLQQEKIELIEVTTNGTLIPDKKLLQLLQHEKVIVRISDYGDLVDKSKIINFMYNHGIRYKVLDLGKWLAPGGVDKRYRSVSDLQEIWGKCPAGYGCKSIFDGRMFSCARAASLYALGFMKEKEYVSLDDTLRVEDVKTFICKSESVACDYCDQYAGDGLLVDPGVQIETNCLDYN